MRRKQKVARHRRKHTTDAVPESLNRAATGLFEASENPNAPLLHDENALKAEHAIDEVERDITAHGEQHAGDGAAELSLTPGRNDRIVGPDIGRRPHRPEAGKPRRR